MALPADEQVGFSLSTQQTGVEAVVGQRDEAHLCVYNVGQVERLLHDGHEGLPEVCGDKHVGHGQQAVGPEGLNQEQPVDGLPDGC